VGAGAVTGSEAGAGGNLRALASVLAGLLAAATMPVAILATRYSESYDLLHAGFAIPVAIVLGGLAIVLGRRALRHDDVRLGRAGGRGAARIGRAFGVLGIALAATCLVALAVYGLLTYLGER
jgi:nitrogen fixation/metabolism regulation signal transduction histidine kinase